MIIFFGTRSTHLNNKHFEHTVCPECGQKGHIYCSIFGNYAHVFWIPFFPYKKKAIAQCMYCKRQYSLYEIPDEIKNEVYHFKASVRTPVWHWLGLILAVFFIISITTGFLIYGFKTTQERNENNNAYIASPEVSDVYSYKEEEENISGYSLMRIEAIQNDTIYFADNKYVTKYSSKVHELHADSLYDKENLIFYTLSELKTLLKEGKIIRIYRKPPVLLEEFEQHEPEIISEE